MNRWDSYFINICNAVSQKSPCLSRQIGAILVRDKSIVATGYNGPPRGFPHCEEKCPRKTVGAKSGERLDLCFAAHAERNCLINAARLGVSTLNTTLYMNTVIPCKDCLIELVNAGVDEIVTVSLDFYDSQSWAVIHHCKLVIRNIGENPYEPDRL